MQRIEFELCEFLIKKGMKIAVAESCTGGMIAAKITSVPGASCCFDLGVVTYSNEQKNRILGVKTKTLKTFGAVSKKTALEMCKGVAKLAKSDIGISVTGIAGPTGGTPEKPVGTVWIGVFSKKSHEAYKFVFDGDRDEVRSKTCEKALNLALKTALK